MSYGLAWLGLVQSAPAPNNETEVDHCTALGSDQALLDCGDTESEEGKLILT